MLTGIFTGGGGTSQPPKDTSQTDTSQQTGNDTTTSQSDEGGAGGTSAGETTKTDIAPPVRQPDASQSSGASQSFTTPETSALSNPAPDEPALKPIASNPTEIEAQFRAAAEASRSNAIQEQSLNIIASASEGDAAETSPPALGQAYVSAAEAQEPKVSVAAIDITA